MNSSAQKNEDSFIIYFILMSFKTYTTFFQNTKEDIWKTIGNKQHHSFFVFYKQNKVMH